MELKVFICGGGTGGHFFSGLAVAEEILEKMPTASIHFVGTRLGIEGRTPLPDSRMQIHFISARGLLGKGLFAKCLGLLSIMRGIVESLALLWTEKPGHILGVGGYASAPTVFAAICIRFFSRFFFLRSRLLSISVLEQNSYAGMSNRALKALGAQAFSAFPQKGFEVVDLPLRRRLQAAAQTARPADWPPKVLLIVGGSQGARGLNEALQRIFLEDRNFFQGFQILHQTGAKAEEELKDFYKREGFQAEVFAFSSEMARYYERADCILCRSGAMTVLEVIAFRRPVIFIPFPAATHDHQFWNAKSAQNSKWIIRESELSAKNIMNLLKAGHPEIPKKVASCQLVARLLALE